MTTGTVSRSAVVDASPEKTLQSWIDFNWYQLGLVNGKAKIVEEGDASTGVGSTRVVGGLLTETLSAVEQNKVNYTMTSRFSTDYLATVTFEETEDGKTKVTWTSELEANALVVASFRLLMGGMIQAQLNSLGTYVASH
mmetsp:Transcript_15274/g.18540  ORF Transcript_15274/g.18540 Transcript_15274/m.18540 type:complete len:139 (-) Transcript_15274:154-570(-)|eukprot:CAMPEP_0184020572 /NCGR_PEP_ID=MMETSP0954-20121128/9420_1 /TAXON_ID=627963 /ORGANISM="Aplanochytrium sp, Strain PBS07" /LENGTH=138 /DNA_ID=CAMNT_0026302441 /DNA_START=61 /DNA_END=477 /DNA_ORIENTATION=+